MKYYVAEFQKPFLDLLSAISDAAPLAFFNSPKIYLHDIGDPDSYPAEWRGAKTLRAELVDMQFAYHPFLKTTQVVSRMLIKGSPKGFTTYASMCNDAYRSRTARQFARNTFTSIQERRLVLDVNVIEVDSNSDDGRLLAKTFFPINWDSLV